MLKSVLLQRYLRSAFCSTYFVYLCCTTWNRHFRKTSLMKKVMYSFVMHRTTDCLNNIFSTVWLSTALNFSSINRLETKEQRTKRNALMEILTKMTYVKKSLQLYLRSINLCETKSQRTKRHSNTRQNDLYPKRSWKRTC